MTEQQDWRRLVGEHLALHDMARVGPVGTWAQIWIPFVCKHAAVRCVHGDEIIRRRFRRCACLICGRSLDRPLPEFCFFSPRGARHSA